MASLRFMSFPSTSYLSAEPHLFSSLQKPYLQSHSSLSCSFSPPLSHSLSLPTRTKRLATSFVPNFSATAQEQALDSSSSADTPRELSTTRLIFQNIPWEATADDVRTLCQQYGTVLDVELSMYTKTKNRGLAFVSFSTADEAQAALSNIKDFNGRNVNVNYAYQRERKSPTRTKPPVPSSRFHLFVANLSFKTKTKDLKEFFQSEYDSVHSAEIIYHEKPRRPSGYGFVAFNDKKQAEAALTAFQGKILMGKPIRVQRSRLYAKQGVKPKSVQTDDSLAELKSDADQAETAVEN